MDYTVENTNSDALVAKLSSIKKGYYQDKFASHFSSGN